MLPSDHLHVGPRQCIFNSLQVGLRVVGMGDNNDASFLSDATHSEEENIVVKRHHSMRFRELTKCMNDESDNDLCPFSHLRLLDYIGDRLRCR